MSERIPCQVCGRALVPLKSGRHRDHKPPHSNEPYYRCIGSGFRAKRWPVGQQLRHHAGSRWEIIEDRGGQYGDYLIRCLFVPAGINERPVGSTMITHGEYMHRHGWEAIDV